MYQYMQFLTKKWRQQGAIIAFTALLLPMIIVGVGLAVDLGNIYVQHARLQNAADAAALAGAKAYAENNETVDKHPKANDKAEKYIQGEFHNLEDKQREKIEDNYEDGKKDRYKAQTKDDITYYRVKLIKEVPLYFLGSFYKKISGKNTFTVPVFSVAAIQSRDGGKSFKNLFIFSKEFKSTNSANNSGELGKQSGGDTRNIILESYKGRISYTDGEGGINVNPLVKYSSQIYNSNYRDKIKGFYTPEAKKLNETKNLEDINKLPQAEFDSNGNLKSGYWSPALPYPYDFEEFIDYMDGKTVKAPSPQNFDDLSTDSRLFKDNDYIRIKKDTVNPTIKVKKTNYNNTTPIYIFIEAGNDIVKVEMDDDNERPLIICVGDKKKDSSRPNVHIEIRNHTFKGVIYAPYSREGEEAGVHINAAYGKFYGTIVSSYIDLSSGPGQYEYRDYMGDAGRSSGESYSTNGIALVSSPEGLNWD